MEEMNNDLKPKGPLPKVCLELSIQLIMSDLPKSDKEGTNYPDLGLAQTVFEYEQDREGGGNGEGPKEIILKAIDANEMISFYESCCSKYGWTMDSSKIASMRESNEKALAEISTKTEEAIVNAGDTEVLDLMFNKAAHHTKVGAWDLAFDAYDEIIKKEKISSGKKLDAVMAKCRIALFNMDLNNCKTLLAEAKRLNDLSGDWDHRNRLKVYEAMYLLTVRDFKASSVLLQSCIATFTCTEICDYNQFMFYALLTNVMNLPRIELQKKIVNDPQVISVIRELPNMQTFVNSIYQCEYKPFVETLVAIAPRIQRDRYLGPHTVYVLRECRILAYSQFLEAYRSVLLQSMADNFGMSLELLDKELSHFISAGRLNAKIDKVGMVVETSRPDKKNAQYLDVIKKGDALLNQVQKLARVVEL